MLLRLAQFEKDPVGSLGVEKGDLGVVGSPPRLLIDQGKSFGFQFFEGFLDVVHFQGDMMDPLSSFFYVAGNRPVGLHRLEKLNGRIPQGDERDLVVRRNLPPGDGQPQDLGIEFLHLFDALHGYSDVGNLKDHLALLSSSTEMCRVRSPNAPSDGLIGDQALQNLTLTTSNFVLQIYFTSTWISSSVPF